MVQVVLRLMVFVVVAVALLFDVAALASPPFFLTACLFVCLFLFVPWADIFQNGV